MSAAVCGKRPFLDELESAAASSTPPSYKKFRYASPTRFTYSPPVDQLKALFPKMEIQLLHKALEEAGNDIDSAIIRLNQLRLDGAKQSTGFAAKENINIEQNAAPIDGAAWVDLIVNEMRSATSIDDAKSRASHVLESLEKFITARTGCKVVVEGFLKGHKMLKEQIEALLRENAILKRAVSIQHERQKEYDEEDTEAQQLKQLLAQYHEQLKTLKMDNYRLTLQLRQGHQSSPIPGHYHPDVF